MDLMRNLVNRTEQLPFYLHGYFLVFLSIRPQSLAIHRGYGYVRFSVHRCFFV